MDSVGCIYIYLCMYVTTIIKEVMGLRVDGGESGVGQGKGELWDDMNAVLMQGILKIQKVTDLKEI